MTFLDQENAANFSIISVSRFSGTTESKFPILKQLEEWNNDLFNQLNDGSSQAFKIRVRIL